MAGGKVSPRQKMINMMYLVLTALLALNVSKEILKSFHLFEKSFVSAAKNIDAKSQATIAALQTAMKDKPGKTKPYMDRALKVQQETAKFITYVDGINAKIEGWYEGREIDEVGGQGLMPLKSPDQMSDHAGFYTNNNYEEGYKVSKMINDTRENILQYLKPQVPGMTDSTSITKLDLYNEVKASSQLHAEGEGTEEGKMWVVENLEHNPAGGVTAWLARLKNDAKTLESEVLEKLAQQIDATDFKFDKLSAYVLPKSNYVMKGTNYEADILLVASNSTVNPYMEVNGGAITVEGGVGHYSQAAGASGLKSFTGRIVLKGVGGGENQVFEFPKQEYQVFEPAATIAATKMNLLYKGINNPMSISVPGFSAKDINISWGGLQASSKGGGVYNVKVPGSLSGVVTISASIKTKEGKVRSVGSSKFRVRGLPQPTAQLGGIRNDGLPKGKSAVAAQTSLIATMGASFAYDLKYRVNGFKMIIAYRRKPPKMASSSSGALTSEMKGLLRGLRSGDKVVFEGIRATEATYGFKKSLSAIIISIK